MQIWFEVERWVEDSGLPQPREGQDVQELHLQERRLYISSYCGTQPSGLMIPLCISVYLSIYLSVIISSIPCCYRVEQVHNLKNHTQTSPKHVLSIARGVGGIQGSIGKVDVWCAPCVSVNHELPHFTIVNGVKKKD